MKKKSKKIIKLERNRFSVFYTLDYCMNCGSQYQLTKHEVFEGRNRLNSMEDGFVLPLCWNCHRQLQDDKDFLDYWKKKAQTYYEEHLGTREDFIKRYRRNYL